MKYQSTRGHSERVDGAEAVLQGIAPDGGLYLPVDFDKPFDWEALMDKDFEGQAEAVFAWFFDDLPDIPDIVRRAYEGKFTSPEITPLRKVGDRWVLELFHGPTSAFKDVALSALPVLLSEAREKKIREEGAAPEILILTATSGDTGKAALEGFKDVPGIRIHVFYPDGGVSPVQERQMTSQEGANVRVSAIRGNFDDAQSAVKEIFTRVKEEQAGLEGMEKPETVLSSANSINIGRLVPQIVYYFKAYSDLLREGAIELGDLVDFTVPTGNFGDIFAGYLAMVLGLPVGRLICASNQNDVLTDFLTTGFYDRHRKFYKTSSPSMDILVSSNLERLLYMEGQREHLGKRPERTILTPELNPGVAHISPWAFAHILDIFRVRYADLGVEDAAEVVRNCMEDLAEKGLYKISPEMQKRIREVFVPGFATEEEVRETIGRVFKEQHYLMDPHTAVAWCVSEKVNAEDYGEKIKDHITYTTYSPGPGKAMVVLSTASPYKFPRTVLEAIGETPGEDDFALMDELYKASGVPVPENLAALRDKPVRFSEVLGRDELYDVVREEMKP